MNSTIFCFLMTKEIVQIISEMWRTHQPGLHVNLHIKLLFQAILTTASFEYN